MRIPHAPIGILRCIDAVERVGTAVDRSAKAVERRAIVGTTGKNVALAPRIPRKFHTGSKSVISLSEAAPIVDVAGPSTTRFQPRAARGGFGKSDAAPHDLSREPTRRSGRDLDARVRAGPRAPDVRVLDLSPTGLESSPVRVPRELRPRPARDPHERPPLRSLPASRRGSPSDGGSWRRRRTAHSSSRSVGISWYAGKRFVASFEKTSLPSRLTSNAPPFDSTRPTSEPGNAAWSSAARPTAWGL